MASEAKQKKHKKGTPRRRLSTTSHKTVYHNEADRYQQASVMGTRYRNLRSVPHLQLTIQS